MNQGSYFTGVYTNYFETIGISQDEVDARLDQIFNTLFHGDDSERIYHPCGDDMGYVVDTGNNDARTEGMSYGMMVCVQLDHKDEFDRIWKWARTHMYLNEGRNRGFFCWSNSLDGSKNAGGPAPDGEEFFAMALLFASHRWGDGEGIFNYSKEACDLLHSMVRVGIEGKLGRGMFDPQNHLIRFICEVDYSDPSYHLPHFYELFAKWAYPEDRTFFAQAAVESRQFLHKACHPETGLCAEYAYYDGTPYEKDQEIFGKHDWYYSDAYRTIMNIALDHIWFAKDPWQEQEGVTFLKYYCETLTESKWDAVMSWDGQLFEEKALHPTAVIASNATAGILSGDENGKNCIEKFSKTPLRGGDRRYYDNFLYTFAFLMLGGRYRIY